MLASFLGALTGVDSSDIKTIDSKGNAYDDYLQFLNKDGLKGKKIGYLKSEEGKNVKVDMLVNDAISFMEKMGAEIIHLENCFGHSIHRFKDYNGI